MVVIGSSALVASSHNSTSGFVASALAMATLCFCPPDNCAGYDFALSKRPTSSNSSIALFLASAFFTPAISRGNIIFPRTFLCDSRLNC